MDPRKCAGINPPLDLGLCRQGGVGKSENKLGHGGR